MRLVPHLGAHPFSAHGLVQVAAGAGAPAEGSDMPWSNKIGLSGDFLTDVSIWERGICSHLYSLTATGSSLLPS